MMKSVTSPVADILDPVTGKRLRQMLFGSTFVKRSEEADYAQGYALFDGYEGAVLRSALGEYVEADYTVSARATHIYELDDFKSEPRGSLSFGSVIKVVDERKKFVEISTGGFVPKAHIRLKSRPFQDYVSIAQIFFGTPYLWGGNSCFGIDCSGLVQVSLAACGIAAPGDSFPQENAIGSDVLGEPYQRGDVLFWPGHVAICVDEDTLIHANAHHMAVAYENIEKAIARIRVQGDGNVSAHKRLW